VRRAALLVLVVALATAAFVATARAGRDAPVPGPGADPVLAARRAHDLARAEPLLITLVASDGREVARALLGGSEAEVSVAGLAGVQEGTRLSALGTTVEVPAVDPGELLAPLVERRPRWVGRHLSLEGNPSAQAWLDGDGRLARLEVDLGAGSLLVVSPAG